MTAALTFPYAPDLVYGAAYYRKDMRLAALSSGGILLVPPPVRSTAGWASRLSRVQTDRSVAKEATNHRSRQVRVGKSNPNLCCRAMLPTLPNEPSIVVLHLLRDVG